VWKFYSDSCLQSLLKPVCYSLFVELWNEVIPWVVIAKPATDLCWKCQQNNNAILKASNVPDEDKAQLLLDQLKHLEKAKKEREYYKMQCQLSKENLQTSFPNFSPFQPHQPCSYQGIAHYSWDFAQQIHYPSDPFQPGPIYFKTPRKCGIFGLTNDAINIQYNYLIDEIVNTRKGANTTISYVHKQSRHGRDRCFNPR